MGWTEIILFHLKGPEWNVKPPTPDLVNKANKLTNV